MGRPALREGAYRGQPPVPVEEAEAASLGSLPPQGGPGRVLRPPQGVADAIVGLVYAEDEESAIAAAIEEHNVKPADQWRLFARPHE